MRILYVSGGSVGHLAPLVAIDRTVKDIKPVVESLFLCSDRPDDAEYLKKESVTFKALPRPGKSLAGIKALFGAYRESKKILKAFKPDVVLGKGSSVSVPACYAAKHLGIPVIIHESDAVMGTANRMTAKWADKICVGFAQASGDHRAVHTGNPIRADVTSGSRDEGLRITKFSGKKPVLMVMGGSQGAQALNDAVVKNIDRLLAVCDVIHLTGNGKKGATPRAGYWSKEFAHEELPHLYAIADLALSRASAGAMGELAANEVPMILVPIEGLANDHQVWNARAAKATGGCMMLRQVSLQRELAETVEWLVRDVDARKKMSQDVRALHHPDAARRIAETLFECIARRPLRH